MMLIMGSFVSCNRRDVDKRTVNHTVRKRMSNLVNIYWSLIPKYILLSVTILNNKVLEFLILHNFCSEAGGMVQIINRIWYCTSPREPACPFSRLCLTFSPLALWFDNIFFTRAQWLTYPRISDSQFEGTCFYLLSQLRNSHNIHTK